jgi:uncharacterized protein (TIGR01370 family)
LDADASLDMKTRTSPHDIAAPRHARAALGFALATVMVLSALPAQAATPTHRRLLTPVAPRLSRVHDWAFGLGSKAASGTSSEIISRFKPFDMVVLDGEGTRPADIHALKRRGVIVLAYLSVGTIEPGRWWYYLVKPYRLDLWGDWGEWYADTRAPGYRKVIVGKVAPWMLGRGFDGLFLDNTDMIETHPTRAAGMRTLVRGLSVVVHGSAVPARSRRRRFLFAQNGEGSVSPILGYLDGWNREDVSFTYDFDTSTYGAQPWSERAVARKALWRIRRKGLLTLATSYSGEASATVEAVAIRDARAVAALPYISDIWLDRVPAAPFR